MTSFVTAYHSLSSDVLPPVEAAVKQFSIIISRGIASQPEKKFNGQQIDRSMSCRILLEVSDAWKSVRSLSTRQRGMSMPPRKFLKLFFNYQVIFLPCQYIITATAYCYVYEYSTTEEQSSSVNQRFRS